MPQSNIAKLDYGGLTDLSIARLCAAGDGAAMRHVITCNNQRLFRTAWSITGSKTEAEDAVQAAYLSAFAKMGSFAGRSALSTWLTRIVANEALSRLRAERHRRERLEQEGVAVMMTYRQMLMRGSDPEHPDAALGREQIRRLLENAIADLPAQFRTVFVLREIEGLSSLETSEILDLPEPTVKTRLFRAKRRLRQVLAPEVASALHGTFPFAGSDCASLTQRVLTELGFQQPQ